MKTKTETVSQKLQIWAIPKSTWEIENHPEEPPFEYKISTGKPWRDGAVMVHEAEVKMIVPEGIDLTKAAVETLKEAQKELRKEKDAEIASLQDQINNLLMLEHQKPDLEVVKHATDQEYFDQGKTTIVEPSPF